MKPSDTDAIELTLERRAIRRRKKKYPAMKVNSRSVFGLVRTIGQRATTKK
jgi:hypothetical protein